MTDPEELTHETALHAFRVAFMRRVGQQGMSYGDLSDKTGIQVRTLKSWRDGQAMPHLGNWLKLCGVFGPDFASECLHVVGLGGVEAIRDTPVDVPGCVADLAEQINNITHRLLDGSFCHRDKAETGPQLLRLAAMLEQQARAMLGDIPH